MIPDSVVTHRWRAARAPRRHQPYQPCPWPRHHACRQWRPDPARRSWERRRRVSRSRRFHPGLARRPWECCSEPESRWVPGFHTASRSRRFRPGLARRVSVCPTGLVSGCCRGCRSRRFRLGLARRVSGLGSRWACRLAWVLGCPTGSVWGCRRVWGLV